jgi:hypothetical protein
MMIWLGSVAVLGLLILALFLVFRSSKPELPPSGEKNRGDSTGEGKYLNR